MENLLADPVVQSFFPMHLKVTSRGKISEMGKSLVKIIGAEYQDKAFHSIFHILRPQEFRLEAFKEGDIEIVKLRLLRDADVTWTAMVLKLSDGFFMNLSLGLAVADIHERYGLDASDFAPTDAAFDLLFMIEMLQIQMAESKRLTQRLHDDRRVANRVAQEDPLTGLANRRALMDYLTSTHTRKALLPFAFLLIDLDFFKQVNDSFGHLVGDDVLKIVSRRILSNTRVSDVVARIGGDEFAVVLHGLDNKSAIVERAERIIAHISKPIKSGKIECGVGASIGARLVMSPLAQEQMIEEVDQMLYAAKSKGRGQVCFLDQSILEKTG